MAQKGWALGILIIVLMVKGSAGGKPNLLALGVQKWDLQAISIFGEPRKFTAREDAKEEQHQK
jgi:hypothetical protein